MDYFRPSPWSLDYLLGLKYIVLDGKPVARIARPRERSFIVREIAPSFFLRDEGSFCVYLVAKRGLSTHAAVAMLAKALRNHIRGRPRFFGLKDTDATATQYVCIPCKGDPPRHVNLRNIWARLIGRTDVCKERPPEGNRFWIILEPLNSPDKIVEKIIDLREKLLPNYYGYQRFGTRRPNTHLLGIALLLGNYVDYADEMINSPYPDEDPESIRCRLVGWSPEACIGSKLYEFTVASESRCLSDLVKKLPKGIYSVYFSALQAFIYNLYLSKRIEKGVGINEKLSGERIIGNRVYAPVPGIGYKIGVEGEARQLLRSVLDDIGLSEEEISKPLHKSMRSRPYWRPVYMKPEGLQARKLADGKVLIEFSLEHGMYATIVLRELVKIPDGL
ncbi:tRNA pseudouridine(13) synthase TruD [Pyrofollis japonicus]|uniref:tRNA pseudouridine(13) synthase TruD n=1 Tax=Pyrofollis japonicus TaxID=3060460 RepID=UPI00295C0F32|nr:tRNA pseudouridine(13) synthase TruD [Pyrofollis japonicus]BEP17990.1 tRNA pseudouridine(13) synthase TruD [Pyrofollis japonicus]